MSTTDVATIRAEMRARAQEATPGRWHWSTSNSWNRLSTDIDGRQGRDGGVLRPFVSRSDGHPCLSVLVKDMEHIATSSPANVIGVLDADAAEIARLTANTIVLDEGSAPCSSEAFRLWRATVEYYEGVCDEITKRADVQQAGNAKACAEWTRTTLERDAERARADAAKAVVRELREALKPFAEEAGSWGCAPEDFHPEIDHGAKAVFSVFDLRRAARVFAATSGEEHE